MFRSIKNYILGKRGLEADFDRTYSVKIRVGDRVRHRTTNRLGHVYQTGTVDGSINLAALSVRHDDGTDAILVPAEEYTKADKVLAHRY